MDLRTAGFALATTLAATIALAQPAPCPQLLA